MATKEEIEQAKQEAKDKALAPKLEKLYNDASSTPPSQRPAASEPKKFAKGGSVGSASRRADGIAQRGKTRGKMI